MVARKDHFDVIVIGAGPAGCAAAIQCARYGYNVALLEREVFPRHRPGETLHPGVEPLLRQLGLDAEVLAADFVRHSGNWVRWPSQLQFQSFGSGDGEQWKGFQAWRPTFDSLMLNRARELGVFIQQPCKVITPIRSAAAGVSGVQTPNGPLTSDYVIDAAGSSHWLARKLSLNIRRYSPRLRVDFGYVEGDCDVRNDAPALIANANGWTWTARVKSRLYHWSSLSWCPRDTEALPPDELCGLQPHGRKRSDDVSWRLVTEAAGPGYFLVGDAAAVLDPLASKGVLRGLMSGIMAAHLIVNRSKLTHDEMARVYCGWLTRWFESDVSHLKELYKQLPNCGWAHNDLDAAERTR
jgi:flavin-dependent dehydrogenase